MNNNASPKKPGTDLIRNNHRIKHLFSNKEISGYKKTLLTINVLSIVLLLIAGLWPFEFKPGNAVDRLPNINGIVIHNKCLIHEKLKKNDTGIASFLSNPGALSIEFLVKPYTAIDDTFAAILCIYDDFDPELLMIARWKSNFILRRRNPLPDGTYDYHEVSAENVLLSGKKYHVMISMDRKGSSIFINGKEEKLFSEFCVRTGKESSSGYRISLGNEPRVKVPWIGEISGLAIYNGSHNARDAMQHCLAWSKHDYKSLSQARGIVALYPMNEGGGPVLRNIISKKGDLIIPKHLHALKKSFLSLPWINFWQYVDFYYDLIINIMGFIPLGFFLIAFFISWYKRAGILFDISTIFIGSFISFSIELIQVFMPARTSSLTDILCNILGTILGVVLFHKAYKVYLSKTKKPDGSGLSIT